MGQLREKLKDHTSGYGKAFNVISQVLILISIVSFTLETEPIAS